MKKIKLPQEEMETSMNTIFYAVETENQYDQILMFDTHKEAVSWCKSATRWSDDEIAKHIKKHLFTLM